MSIASWTSPPASARTLPISAHHQLGELVLRARRSAAPTRKRISARFGRRHEPPALVRRLRGRRRRGRRPPRRTAGRRRSASPVAGFVALERLAARGVDPLAADVVLKVFVPAVAIAPLRRSGSDSTTGARRLPRERPSSGNVPGTRARRRSRVCRRSFISGEGFPCRGGRGPAPVDDDRRRSGCPCSTRRASRRARPRAPAG